MKVLLVQNEIEEIRERIAFALEGAFGATLLHASTIAEAKKMVSSPQVKPDLIVCDVPKAMGAEYEMLAAKATEASAKAPKGSKAEGEKSTAEDQPQTIPFIACIQTGQQPPTTPNWRPTAAIDRNNLIDNLVKVIELLIEKGIVSNEGWKQKYCRIRTKLLLSVYPLKGDIFIRLSDDHYVKLFHQGDQFEVSDLNKYTIKKGIEYLYIKTADTTEFIHKYNAELQRILKNTPVMALQDANRISEQIYESVAEMGREMGFTRDVQALAKTQMQVTMNAMGKSPKLSDFLRKIENFKGEYLANHSLLTGYLACAIASHMEWGSEQTFQKLNLAAFLHDITLDNSALAKCRMPEDAEKAGFSKEQVNVFRQHPIKAADVAKGFSEVPPDVDSIIFQHHETPEGTGFPRRLKHAFIAPLSAVFIVAHDLADFSLEHEGNFTPAEFLELTAKRYSSSKFQRVVASLQQILKV